MQHKGGRPFRGRAVEARAQQLRRKRELQVAEGVGTTDKTAIIHAELPRRVAVCSLPQDGRDVLYGFCLPLH